MNARKSYSEVLRFIAKHPCTFRDVATKTGLSYRGAVNVVKTLHSRGQVRKAEKVENIQIWELS